MESRCASAAARVHPSCARASGARSMCVRACGCACARPCMSMSLCTCGRECAWVCWLGHVRVLRSGRWRCLPEPLDDDVLVAVRPVESFVDRVGVPVLHGHSGHSCRGCTCMRVPVVHAVSCGISYPAVLVNVSSLDGRRMGSTAACCARMRVPQHSGYSEYATADCCVLPVACSTQQYYSTFTSMSGSPQISSSSSRKLNAANIASPRARFEPQPA
jgi:hypothetical protein